MAPYLAFFAAGDFTSSTTGVERRAAVVRRGVEAAARPLRGSASMRLMRQTPGAASRWLERRSSATTRSRPTGGLVTSLDPGFALENQTRPTYSGRRPGDRRTGRCTSWRTSGSATRSSVQNWRDIWLNEGSATFMEVRYDETHGGAVGRTQWLREQLRPRTAPTTAFWDLRIARPGRAADIFDDRGLLPRRR